MSSVIPDCREESLLRPSFLGDLIVGFMWSDELDPVSLLSFERFSLVRGWLDSDVNWRFSSSCLAGQSF